MKSQLVAPAKDRSIMYRGIKIQPIIGKCSQTGEALHEALMAKHKAVE